eukprot:CAMPEP_0115355774 /NCGR_PEP_ID=MMETSP0270-20121206/99271_1 /TAXON_ID=71861 /ORGANISM="Scrippsiella trochoidea, Strain CCMP3099" /LENGTH=81 /DNA_ID=CAMNT_0002778141 /DNA_START=922 /DNA_END=1164 /DNA_ORIENTATION=+
MALQHAEYAMSRAPQEPETDQIRHRLLEEGIDMQKARSTGIAEIKLGLQTAVAAIGAGGFPVAASIIRLAIKVRRHVLHLA